MRLWPKALLCVAGLAALMGVAGAEEVRLPARLTSFGAPLSLSQPLALLGPAATFSGGDFSANGLFLPGSTARGAFAASLALSPKFALDSGYNLDLTQRFGNFDALKSPLLPDGNFLALANGGLYAGATWLASPSLTLRVGAAERSNKLDRFSFDPVSARLGLPLAFDSGRSQSLLAGITWNVNDWAQVGLTAAQNSQAGIPYGVNPLGNLSDASRINTNGIDVSARFKLGSGWVTTASYAEGLSQLDLRDSPAQSSRSYAIAIAKHGVFGDDAIGFSFSHPAPGVLANGFDLTAGSGDVPSTFVASGRVPDQAPETDLQLGYVTSFLDGALALQANASYQMNYQGQNGANSVSVLSRAKIKF